MKILMAAALMVTASAMAPVSAFASNDRKEIEEACRQVAIDEDIAEEELEDFVADCIAANLEAEEGESAADVLPGGTIPERMSGQVPEQE